MQTRREHAYTQIRERLTGGRLRPGDRIAEVALASELKVSRGPLREAINQLASEGLLTRTPGVGAFVPILDTREIRELYEVRAALESFVAGRAAREMRASEIDELAALVEEMRLLVESSREQDRWTADDRRKGLELDVTFHRLIVGSAGNQRLEKLIADHSLLASILPYDDQEPTSSTHETRSEAVAEHQAILDAITSRDPVRASECMRQHVETATRNALATAKALEEGH